MILLEPSGDNSGATDTNAITNAIASAPKGASVTLDAGDWYTNAPINLVDGMELAGIKGGINGATSNSPAGTVIHPVAAFSVTGGIIDLNSVTGCRIRDLAILNDLGSPPDLNGISCHGNVNGLEVEHVSVCLVSGYGLAYIQVGGVDGDGLWMSRCMFERTGKSAVHRPCNDANIHNVHIQFAGNVAGAADGHGFFTDAGSGGNITYVGCRCDLNFGSGWLIDHKGAFGDATKLVGCSTERNFQHGVYITNSSAGGSDWRSPVIISGCCFEGDGQNSNAGGEYAGIWVEGNNRVFISGTATAVNNGDVPAGAPKYALGLNTVSGTQPETVEWASGRMNYSTGQSGQAILNHSLVGHLAIGPTVTQAGGYESTSVACKAGKVALSAGHATVTNPWVNGSSLILLTTLIPSGTPGSVYVSSRTTGSFVIKSTNTGDTGTVAYQIV